MTGSEAKMYVYMQYWPFAIFTIRFKRRYLHSMDCLSHSKMEDLRPDCLDCVGNLRLIILSSSELCAFYA